MPRPWWKAGFALFHPTFLAFRPQELLPAAEPARAQKLARPGDTRAGLLDVMVALAQEGVTMIVVTHEMGFARKVADRIVLMDQGRIVENSATQQFFSQPRSERAREFLAKIIH